MEAARRRLPASNARYRDRSFWESRYRDEGAAPAEWFGGLRCFRPQLEAELSPTDRILVLGSVMRQPRKPMRFWAVSQCQDRGCGNSALSHDLYQLGYTDITSIDYSAVCITSMRDYYGHCPGLQWAVMDAQTLAFRDKSFDVVLEKGTLDSMMVEETDPWHVSQEAKTVLERVLAEFKRVLDISARKEQCPREETGPGLTQQKKLNGPWIQKVSRVLKPRGRFVSITFAQPHFRKRHYAQPAYGWSTRHVAYSSGFHYFVYIMKKGEALSPSDLALGQSLHLPPAAPTPVCQLQDTEGEDFLSAIEL